MIEDPVEDDHVKGPVEAMVHVVDADVVSVTDADPRHSMAKGTFGRLVAQPLPSSVAQTSAAPSFSASKPQ